MNFQYNDQNLKEGQNKLNIQGGIPQFNQGIPSSLVPAFNTIPGFETIYNPESMNSYSSMQNAEMQNHLKKLKEKFEEMKEETVNMDKNPELFKNHQLPLARVKKIMKSDEDVRMISAEAPVLFAKACEIFIVELTHRAWYYTEESKRRTLQRNDIANCIANTDIFDFLIDMIPKEEYKNTQTQKKATDLFNPNPFNNSPMIKDFNLGGVNINNLPGSLNMMNPSLLSYPNFLATSGNPNGMTGPVGNANNTALTGPQSGNQKPGTQNNQGPSIRK